MERLSGQTQAQSSRHVDIPVLPNSSLLFNPTVVHLYLAISLKYLLVMSTYPSQALPQGNGVAVDFMFKQILDAVQKSVSSGFQNAQWMKVVTRLHTAFGNC